MPEKRAGRKVSVLFYLLIFYILLQFSWWAYLLIDLNTQLYSTADSEVLQNKILMVIGEGSVFLLFLLAGFYIMQRTIRKEIRLVRLQSNFLLAITHELKTPLAAIKLSIETLAKRRQLNEVQENQLRQHALQNTERLQGLIDNVLLVTKLEKEQLPKASKPQKISLLTSQIIDRMETAFHLKQPIDRDIQSGLTFPINKDHYESILANLIENAIKYGGGSKIYVRTHREKGKLILTVTDNGPGVPVEAKKRIFDKFFRVENEETRSAKGTGLGLFIVKELVELYNGSVAVSDSDDGGAEFVVAFPCGV